MKEKFLVSRSRLIEILRGEKILQSNDVNVKKLMSEIKSGNIQLPSIQREWIWNDEKIRDIVASVISDYPIGAVLFLKCEDSPIFACNPISGVEFAKNILPKNLILDGQQRLTAIYGAMYNIGQPVSFKKGKSSEERYYYLDIEKVLEDSNDTVEAIISVPKDKKVKKSSKKNAGLDLSTLEKEFENKMFPLNIILSDDEKSDWEDNYKKHYRDKEDVELSKQIENEFKKFKKIFTVLASYTIPVISLDSDTEMDAVCKIFEKVNSSNQPLTGFDLVVAIYAKDNFDLKEDWKNFQINVFSKGILEVFDSKNFLRACKLFAGYKNNNLTFKKNVVTDLKLEYYKKYSEIVSNGFREAKKLLDEEGIVAKNNLPYSSQLIPLGVICALLYENNNLISNSDSVRQKVKQWYWCCVFSKYYENGANDTKFFGDITNFMNWINGGDTPSLIKDFEFDLSKFKDITSNSGALFNGIIALLVKNSCKDFANGRIIKDLYKNGDIAVEIHHIFPKNSYQRQYQDLIESVINKTPLSKKTNGILGDITPSKYLEKIMTGEDSADQNRRRTKKSTTELVSEENLEIYLKSHLIDMEDLENDNFKNFICHRAKKVLKAIFNATGREFVEPTDAEIKKIFFDK